MFLFYHTPHSCYSASSHVADEHAQTPARGKPFPFPAALYLLIHLAACYHYSLLSPLTFPILKKTTLLGSMFVPNLQQNLGLQQPFAAGKELFFSSALLQEKYAVLKAK